MNSDEVTESSRKRVSSIAISGVASSGKTTLANYVSKVLKWDHKNVGDYLRQMALRNGISIEDFGQLDEEVLRNSDLIALEDMKSRLHCVWEGRLSIWLAKGIPNILRVYCVADLQVRIRRFSNREKKGFEEAEKMLLKRDEEERAVFSRLYDIQNLVKESQPDLILDTSSATPEELSRKLMSVVVLE